MNNLYRKVAVTSVGIALGFALGGNKDASSAVITLTSATSFGVTDQNLDGLGDSYYGGTPFYVGVKNNYPNQSTQGRAFYEFNIANSFLASNTVISNAIFQVSVNSTYGHRYFAIDIFGYRGNGQPDASDFEVGSIISHQLSREEWRDPLLNNFNLDFPVTSFVNELISNNDAFAGFSVRANEYGNAILNHGDARLIITTVDAEPVPEPTTIFGSAIGLCLGGWLKRKNSNRQNKTTPQH
jgi:hypothetical protein